MRDRHCQSQKGKSGCGVNREPTNVLQRNIHVLFSDAAVCKALVVQISLLETMMEKYKVNVKTEMT